MLQKKLLLKCNFIPPPFKCKIPIGGKQAKNKVKGINVFCSHLHYLCLIPYISHTLSWGFTANCKAPLVRSNDPLHFGKKKKTLAHCWLWEIRAPHAKLNIYLDQLLLGFILRAWPAWGRGFLVGVFFAANCAETLLTWLIFKGFETRDLQCNAKYPHLISFQTEL